jgi:hypothetical protein
MLLNMQQDGWKIEEATGVQGIQIRMSSRTWFYMVSNTIRYQHIYDRMLISLDDIKW